MSLKSSRVAGFLTSLLLTTSTVTAGFAQSDWAYDRIVSLRDDADTNSIVITTMKGAPIKAPTIQYLPGPNGHAMMVADFHGLSYMMPPHIIRPVQNPAKPGIEEIRVGQFQVNPPICRVAAISRNPGSLKGLSFTANSGKLIVKWTGEKGLLPPEEEEIAKVPQRQIRSDSSNPDTTATTATAAPTVPVAPPRVSRPKATQARPAVVSPEASSYISSSGSIATAVTAPPVAAPRRSIFRSAAAPVAMATAAATYSSAALTYAAMKPSKKETEKAAITDAGKIAVADAGKVASLDGGRSVNSGLAKASAKPTDTAATVAPVTVAQTADSGDQHIQDLMNAAKRSKLVPGKVQNLPKQPQVAVIPPTAPLDQNNKLLTSPLQDQTGTADTIKKPVPSATSSKKKQASEELQDSGESVDLPDKKESDKLRTESKDEKPVGVPMARLSLVCDTDSTEPNAAVQVLSERNITYKSFRLHSPERYILDMTKPEDMDEATVSAFQENALCRSVRIGMTDKKTCRVVFDLASETVQVQEKTFAEDQTVLTLKIFNGAAPVASRTGKPLEGVSIVLDAGHGGTDAGAQRGDAHEKDMTLAITSQLKKKLEAQGAFITMTRSDDTFVSLEDRVKITNLVMPKVFVSVHINSLPGNSEEIKGVETYFQTDQSRPLADAIHNSLYSSLNVPNRGVRKARFYVINHTSVPAILAEVGYISNSSEREKLTSSDYQSKVADALAQGVMLYVSKNPETQTSTVKSPPVINFNQSINGGTMAATTKSVAESLSNSGSSPVRTVK